MSTDTLELIELSDLSIDAPACQIGECETLGTPASYYRHHDECIVFLCAVHEMLTVAFIEQMLAIRANVFCVKCNHDGIPPLSVKIYPL